MDSLRLVLSNPTFFAPAWVFASLNIATGTWVLYLPFIKTKFELNDAQIGIALFCIALGLLISIPFIPFINKKIGVGRSTKIGILIFALAFIIPFVAPHYWILCGALFIVGMLTGFTDVSMNALVSTIEQKEGKAFMATAHGFFSLGGFVSAGIGSLLMIIIPNPAWHMMLMASVIIISNLYYAHHYDQIHEAPLEKPKEKRSWKDFRPLISLAVVAFIIMINEGAVEHWSNLFLFDIVQVSESKAGLGFIAFSFCMMVGRFWGDQLSVNLGTIPLIIYGSLIAFVAYFLIITTNLYATVIGFGLLGLGLSVVIPEIYRLAGKTAGVAASVGISIVSGIGFVGFMLGPVVLGFISNSSNLVWSFVSLSFSVLIAFCLSAVVLRKVYK